MNIIGKIELPFPLSDEEVIRKALTAVTAHVRDHSHESVNVNDCVNAAVNNVKSVWKEARGYRQWYALKENDIREIAEITARIEKELTDRAVKKAGSLLKRQKVRKISAAVAEAMLDDTLGEMGLKYHIIRQTYRAKIHILLPNRKVLQFIILYSEMAAGKTEGILNQIKTVINDLITSGRDIQIMRYRGQWEWEFPDD